MRLWGRGTASGSPRDLSSSCRWGDSFSHKETRVPGQVPDLRLAAAPAPLSGLAGQPSPPSWVKGVVSLSPSLLFSPSSLSVARLGRQLAASQEGDWVWLQWAEGRAPPSPDGGDSVFPSWPQPPVAAQSFQQEISSSSRLSQGLRVWAPPPSPQGPERPSRHRRTPGCLGCWVCHRAVSLSAGVMMAPHSG